MSERVPFADLLDRLRREQAIGVDDHLTLGRFVARSRGASMLELREGLVALFGRDKEGAARVREIFEELYGVLEEPPANRQAEEVRAPDPDPASSPVLRPPPSPRSRWRALLASIKRWSRSGLVLFHVAAGLSLVGLVAWRGCPGGDDGTTADTTGSTTTSMSATTSTSMATTTTSSTSSSMAAVDETVPPPPRPGEMYGAMPGCATWEGAAVSWWQLVPFSLLVIAGTVIAAILSYRKRSAGRRHAARRERFVMRPHGARYERRIVLSPRTFDTAPLMNASSKLERRTQIDVPRTVDETVRRGRLPVIVTRPRRGIARILVLQDMAPSADAYQPVFAGFVASLERQGMEVERLYFRGDLALARRAPDAVPEPLAQATLHAMDRPLVVLSTGELLPTGARELAQLLAPWPARALFTPLSDRSRLPAVLLARTSPLPTFSLDARGIRIAARTMMASLTVVGNDALAPRDVLPSQVLRLRAMLALVPKPTYAIAERLRARFLPHAPRDLLRAMEPIVRHGGSCREAEEALIWFRRMDDRAVEGEPAGREEEEVSVFLAGLLDEARPVLTSDPDAASIGELRWRRDRALVALRSTDADARHAATRTLAELARGPLRAELEGSLRAGSPSTGDADPARGALEDVLARTPDAPASQERAGGARLRWALPTLAQMSVVLVAGILAALAAREVVSWRSGPLPIDGVERVVVFDEQLVRGLCGFDSFGAGMSDAEGSGSGRTILVGTLGEGSGPLDGLSYPAKQVAVVEIVEHTFWRTVSVQRLAIQAVFGPEHMGLKLGAADGLDVAVAYVRGDGVPDVLTWQRAYAADPPTWRAAGSLGKRGFFPVRGAPDDANPITTRDTFAYYSYDTRSYDVWRGAGSPAWARATHARDATLLTQGLLPGTPQEVLLRLIGEEARVPPEDVRSEPVSSSTSTTSSSVSSSDASASTGEPYVLRETVDGTMSSFVDCVGKPDVNVRVRGVLTARRMAEGESPAQQTPIANPWSLVGAPDASFDLSAPPEARSGQTVSIVFAPRTCPRRTKSVVLEVESWSVVANANPPRAPLAACPSTNVPGCKLIEAPAALKHCKVVCAPSEPLPPLPPAAP